MATLNIDNKQYNLDTPTDGCKVQLASFQFVEQELARIQAKAAVLQTATNTYFQALKAAPPLLGGSDKITFI